MNGVVVHFCHATKKTMFRLRRNPKKRAWGRPPMSPRHRVLPPNASSVWLNRTRSLPSVDFAFAASKRTAKTEGYLRKEWLYAKQPPSTFIPSTDDEKPCTCRPTATEAGSAGIRKGRRPLRTFSLVRFFDVCQRNEQKNQLPLEVFVRTTLIPPNPVLLIRQLPSGCHLLRWRRLP